MHCLFLVKHYSPPLYLFWFVFIGTLLNGCRPSDENGMNGVNNRDACAVHLSYEAEVTTVIRPDKVEDASLLSEVDKALMLPTRERFVETACIADDGSYTITTEMRTPEQPINFPERTIGVWHAPKYKRKVNTNGFVQFFNAVGEPIDAVTIEDEDVAALDIAQSFAELKSLPALSDEQFAAGLDTLAAYGMDLRAHPNGIYTSRVNHPDGAYSIQVISKTAHMPIGQLNYSADGQLSTLSMLKVSGQSPNITLEKGIDVVYFKAADSAVRMRRETYTDYKSFTLNIN